MTILIIEDDADYRKMLVQTCRAYGIKVLAPAISDGLALAIYRLPDTDAILCDGLEGRWIEVHAEAVNYGKPFVLLSDDGRELSRANWMGVHAYMKPHSIPEILRELGLLITLEEQQ